MISRSLRIAPSACFGILAVWTAYDVVQVSSAAWAVGLLILLTAALITHLLGNVFRGARARSFGLVFLGAAYYGAHVAVLGVQLVVAVAFLTLLIVYVELRFLSDRFAPIYARRLHPDARRHVDGALARAMLRLLVASVLAVFVPIFAADLALSGLVPLTSILTAIFLAAGLVAVIALLALLPLFERRAPRRAPPEGAHPKG